MRSPHCTLAWNAGCSLVCVIRHDIPLSYDLDHNVNCAIFFLPVLFLCFELTTMDPSMWFNMVAAVLAFSNTLGFLDSVELFSVTVYGAWMGPSLVESLAVKECGFDSMSSSFVHIVPETSVWCYIGLFFCLCFLTFPYLWAFLRVTNLLALNAGNIGAFVHP